MTNKEFEKEIIEQENLDKEERLHESLDLDTEAELFLDEQELILEDNVENQKKYNSLIKRLIKLGLVSIIIVLILVAFGAAYYVVPFTSKVQGTWKNDDMPAYSLKIKNNEATIKVSDLNGTSGANLVIRAIISGDRPNHYIAKESQVNLILDKKKIDQNILMQLKEQKVLYTVKKEDSSSLELRYTKEAMKQAFNSESIDNAFQFQLEFDQLLPKQINFRSSVLSEAGLIFVK